MVGNNAVNLTDILGLVPIGISDAQQAIVDGLNDVQSDWLDALTDGDPYTTPEDFQPILDIVVNSPDGPSPSGPANPPVGWPSAFGDLIDWLSGNSPSNTNYSCSSPESVNISNSSNAEKLEEGYLNKFQDKPCEEWENYTNVILDFGPSEFLRDLFNGTSHFVGSGRGDAYTVSVDPENCTVRAKFIITNTTSLKSALYHLIPDSWNNSSSGSPAANWTQTYCWEKEFECKP